MFKNLGPTSFCSCNFRFFFFFGFSAQQSSPQLKPVLLITHQSPNSFPLSWRGKCVKSTIKIFQWWASVCTANPVWMQTHCTSINMFLFFVFIRFSPHPTGTLWGSFESCHSSLEFSASFMCASTVGLSSFCIVLLFMHREGLVGACLRHKQQH